MGPASRPRRDARPSHTASGNGGRTRRSCSLKAPGSSQGPRRCGLRTQKGGSAGWRDGGSPRRRRGGHPTRARRYTRQTHANETSAHRAPLTRPWPPPGNGCSQERDHVRTHTRSPGSRDRRPECRGPRGQDRAVDKDPEALPWRPHHARQDTRERKWKGGSHRHPAPSSPEIIAAESSRKRTLTTGNRKRPVEQDQL